MPEHFSEGTPYGVFELARLFKKNPQTIRNWIDKGDLAGNRGMAGGQRAVRAGAIVAFVREKAIPDACLDEAMWSDILRESAKELPVLVLHPVTMVVDLEGRVVAASEGSWACLGYDRSSIEGGQCQVEMRVKIQDHDCGLPVPFKELDRAMREPLRITWQSYNDQAKHGTGWITPIRYGENSIGGWCLSFI